ncbi:hypothetical protein ACLM5J_15915 [Nocardioides sp. Bht2]|uniref:hypothetical protein n=1 Tax=Nocardioides sp. Bht2 TaxID=3392297 RepID=UPI0039B5CBD1
MIDRLGGGLAALALSAVALAGLAHADAASDGPFAAAAERISGSTDHRDPTRLTAGLWSDELAPSDEGHFFAYDRVEENTTVHFAAFAAAGAGDSITIETFAGDVSCGSASASSPYSSNGPERVFGATVLIGKQGSSDDCVNQREGLRIVVSRGGSTGDLDPLPIRIKVVEEQRLADQQEHLDPERGSLPEPPDVDPSFAAPDGSTTREIRQGEVQYVPVDLDWGEGLDVEATTASMAEQKIDTGFSGPELTVDLLSPLGVPIDDGLADGDPAESLSSDTSTTVTAGLAPVGYRNRFTSDLPYLPGRYWVVVSLSGAAADAEPVQISYRLRVGANGKRSGVPTYRGGDRPFLIGPDTWATDPSGATNAAAESVDGSWTSTRRWAAVGLGLVGVLCVALGGSRLIWRG